MIDSLTNPATTTPLANHTPVVTSREQDEPWVANLALFWASRLLMLRVAVFAVLVSTVVALLTPNQYESGTRIMPPEQPTGSAAMLAALAGRGSPLSGLAGLTGGLLGAHGNDALFISLLRSGTISGHLIDRFQLQHVYGKRYVEDTAKKLASKTSISEDAKSGVISIVVEDRDRRRARDMAEAYIDELNVLVARVNTSSARREREFIEQRLQTVGQELQQAQVEMSEFSTRNATIDIKEQTRAMVDAGAKLQGQLVAGEAELDSLQQVYGDQNVRVRAAQARVGVLRRELEQQSNGTRDPTGEPADANTLYPALRQLPALAVPWANLYRRVRTEETVYDLLSAQYETARIEEAKSIPTVRVIDPPGWPEKKSSPHRLLMIVTALAVSLVLASFFLVFRRSWLATGEQDTRKIIARQAAASITSLPGRFRRGAR